MSLVKGNYSKLTHNLSVLDSNVGEEVEVGTPPFHLLQKCVNNGILGTTLCHTGTPPEQSTDATASDRLSWDTGLTNKNQVSTLISVTSSSGTPKLFIY